MARLDACRRGLSTIGVVVLLVAAVPAGEAAPSRGAGARDGQVIIREWVPADRVARPARPRTRRSRRARPRRAHTLAPPRRPQNGVEVSPPTVRKASPSRSRAGESASTLNLRAYRLQRAGRHAEAEPLLRRALFLHPDYAYALYNLGWSLLEQGRPREALPFLQRTGALQPHRWEPQQRLSEAYAAVGNREASAIAAARAQRLRSGRPSRQSRTESWEIASW